VLAAYASPEDFFALCDLLARRLAGAGLPQAATLTWICAANVDKAVRQWTADLKKSPRDVSTASLQARAPSLDLASLSVGLHHCVRTTFRTEQGCQGRSIDMPWPPRCWQACCCTCDTSADSL
jgi:hypothetical protein